MPMTDLELARRYAPIIRHEICRAGPHKDFILAFDFDRPADAAPEAFWNWRDPLKKRRIELLDEDNRDAVRVERTAAGGVITDARGAEHDLDLRACVYYAVVRTRTHDFITYAWYHPVDWKTIGTHSNDMEGAMVVAGADGGPVVIAGAIEHLDIHAGRVDEHGQPVTTGRERENEVYLWYRNPRRALLHVETKGHGVWLNAFNRGGENDWHGTVEYQPLEELPDGHVPPPFGREQAATAYGDRDARVKRAYELVAMDQPGVDCCLWAKFRDIRADGSIGMNPPWLWTHSGDVGLSDVGEWFLDPAFYYAYRRGRLGRRWGDLEVRHAVNAGLWALRYVQNPFLKHRLTADPPFTPERNARMLERVIRRERLRNGQYFQAAVLA